MANSSIKKPSKNVCYALGGVLFIALALLLIGSLKDLEISSLFYNKLGDFGSIFSYLLPLPGYVLFSLSGAMIGEGLDQYKKKYQNILAKTPYILTPLLAGLLYGYSSLASSLPLPWALAVGVLSMAAACVLFLFLESKFGKRDLEKEGYAIAIAFFLVYLLFLSLNNGILRVPYSLIEKSNNQSLFTGWWVLEGVDEETIKDLSLERAELKGGPSLSVALSSFLLFLPYVFGRKGKKEGLLLSLFASLFFALGLLSELSLGRYFLSDIAWAMFIGAFTVSFFLLVLVLPKFETPFKRKKDYRPLSCKENEAAAHRCLRFAKRANPRTIRSFRRKRNASRRITVLKSLDDVPSYEAKNKTEARP